MTATAKFFKITNNRRWYRRYKYQDCAGKYRGGFGAIHHYIVYRD